MADRTPDEIEARIAELLGAMTVEEKAGQLTQYFYFSEIDPDADEQAIGPLADQPKMVEGEMAAGRVGSLLFCTQPDEINRLQKLAIEGNPHGIPALFGFDVIHGFRTIFPVPIAVAASFDPDVAERGQAVAAREARAVGIHWAFAPMVDIARDPRWGRIIEGAGEDPVLGAAMAAAQVRGFQGDDLADPERIVAGPKHFAGYGYAIGGRDYDQSDISDADLYNVVFPPFRAAVDAGAGNIMTAYMPLNSVPATGNDWLLKTVLRDEWGFDGFLVSDANAVRNLMTHGFARDLTDAGVRGLRAGLDLEMAIADAAYAHLPEAVASGAVSEADLDACVRRVLRIKLQLGLFENPYVDEARAAAVLADPAHREASKEAAVRTAVLLANDSVEGTPLLPLAPSVAKVAVLGPLADSQRDTLGPWVFDFDLAETVTILDGLKARAGDGVSVEYAPGIRPAFRTFASMFDMWPGNSPIDPEGFDDEAELARAVELAAASDVAVVVLGEWQNMIGEAASRSTLDIPGRQLELLEAVAATGTPVVVLVMNGRPLDLQRVAELSPAILDVWYPGSQGGHAVAALVFGDMSPAGRLPFTWPRTAGQVPLIYSHSNSFEPENQWRRYWDIESTPQFAFGHGLSYSSFSYGPVTLSASSIAAGGSLTASVEVSNTGGRAADEVVQCYVHQCYGTAARPVRELKGFRRVNIAAGATVRVDFEIGPDQLRYWNAGARDWVLDAARFEVGIGPDSTCELAASFEVTG